MNKTVQYLGLDVHKDSIAVSIAPQGTTEVRRYGLINGSLDAVDKLLKKLAADGVELRVVYEAGPCGFVLCRHLRSTGLACEVVAPSLIPKKASDKVKTDRRDADQLARLFRAGELTPIHVPDQEDEAVRDLIRARHSALDDLRKARHRLKGFLLRLAQRALQQVRPWIEPAQAYEKNQLGLGSVFLNGLRFTWAMALLADAAVLLRTRALLERPVPRSLLAALMPVQLSLELGADAAQSVLPAANPNPQNHQ
jgi:transposase